MICLIPARGGSERLPGKNIKSLFGRPVIKWVIDICRDSDLFDDVVVSTDSDFIASRIEDYCTIDYRSKYVHGDVSETKVLIDYMDRKGIDELCRVYPFAALLTPTRLGCGKVWFDDLEVDAVLEMTEYKHPIQRAITHDGFYSERDKVDMRTQDLEPMYHDAATFMYTTREALDYPLGGRCIKWLPVDNMDCQDVDDAEDWEMLKMKFARKYGCNY